MSATRDDTKRSWIGGLVDGAARAFSFGRGVSPTTVQNAPVRDPRNRRRIDMNGLTLQVRHLAAEGHAPAEIARRTALSQDTVALLLTLSPG